MHYRRLAFGIGVAFFTVLCGIGQAQERSEANQDGSAPKSIVPAKHKEQRRQEDAIEAAAFRALLTAYVQKSDRHSPQFVVLSTEKHDRADLRFLKDLHRSDIVVRRFEEIKIEETFDDPRARALGLSGIDEYQDRATGRHATVYSLDEIKWTSDTTAEIHYFVAPNPRGGYIGTYELVRKNGRWSVKGIKPGSEYRA